MELKSTWSRSVALVLLACAVVACRHAPDEVQVRDAITAAAEGAKDGSASAVAAPLSDDFDGNGGALDRQALANLVRLVSLRGDHIGATLGPIGVERRGERLVATFTVSLTSGGRLLPARIGVYQVESAWRRDGSDWRCYSATWKQVL